MEFIAKKSSSSVGKAQQSSPVKGSKNQQNVSFSFPEDIDVFMTKTPTSPLTTSSVIKLPYKINNTEEKKNIYSKKLSSSQSNNKIHRVVEVKKFGAGTTILSPEKQQFLSQNTHLVSPGENQSHISVKSSSGVNTRWPQQIIKRKDIENKPWYLLSFDETVELYCGDDIRAEKYPKYNKSFVTKLKTNSKDEEEKKIFSPGSTTLVKSTRGTGKLQSKDTSPNSVLSKSSKSSSSSLRPKTAPSSSSLSKEEKIKDAIRQKRLKLSELKKEITRTNQKVAELQQISQSEHSKIQHLIEDTELSTSNLNYLKTKTTFLLNKTKLSIQELLHKNNDNQTYMNKITQEIRNWEKEYFFKFNRSNLHMIEQKLAHEYKRLLWKFKIRRILFLFSDFMKSHRYNLRSLMIGSSITSPPSQQPKFNKKAAAISSVTVINRQQTSPSSFSEIPVGSTRGSILPKSVRDKVQISNS
jgi:hypothetical protein